jgi:hypothetical protein
MEPKQALLINFDNDLPERIARGLEDWLFHKIQTEHDDIEWSSVVVKGIQIEVVGELENTSN